MEMPEGWKQLYCPIEMSDSCAVILKPSEARAICDLMKEMAEALEEFATSSEDNYTNSADQVLKKFKKWK